MLTRAPHSVEKNTKFFRLCKSDVKNESFTGDPVHILSCAEEKKAGVFCSNTQPRPSSNEIMIYYVK